MKFLNTVIFFSLFLFSCQNDTENSVKAKKEAKKAEAIFRNIENGWEFVEPMEPIAQSKINQWKEWRNFINEIQQKHKDLTWCFSKSRSLIYTSH